MPTSYKLHLSFGSRRVKAVLRLGCNGPCWLYNHPSHSFSPACSVSTSCSRVMPQTLQVRLSIKQTHMASHHQELILSVFCLPRQLWIFVDEKMKKEKYIKQNSSNSRTLTLCRCSYAVLLWLKTLRHKAQDSLYIPY